MGWTEFGALVEGLPAESATAAALSGDSEGRRWGESQYLQAYTTDLLALLVKLLWRGDQPPNLPPVIRPGEQRQQQDDSKRRELLERMAAMRPPRDR